VDGPPPTRAHCHPAAHMSEPRARFSIRHLPSWPLQILPSCSSMAFSLRLPSLSLSLALPSYRTKGRLPSSASPTDPTHQCGSPSSPSMCPGILGSGGGSRSSISNNTSGYRTSSVRLRARSLGSAGLPFEDPICRDPEESFILEPTPPPKHHPPSPSVSFLLVSLFLSGDTHLSGTRYSP
jgi:hypothetical protein